MIHCVFIKQSIKLQSFREAHRIAKLLSGNYRFKVVGATNIAYAMFFVVSNRSFFFLDKVMVGPTLGFLLHRPQRTFWAQAQYFDVDPLFNSPYGNIVIIFPI